MSLCYMLAYFLNDGRIPEFDYSKKYDKEKTFDVFQAIKKDQNAFDVCSSPKTIPLLPFVQCIWDLTYEGEPDYNKLRKYL